MNEIMNALRPASLSITHCWEAAQEVLQKQTPHFTRENIYYSADGLNLIYKCSIDEKTYTITIKEREA
jgi:hypothetical protein